LDEGTFTLSFLLSRHTNVSLLPNRQVVVDEEFSTYKLGYLLEVADKSRIKELLEKHKKLHAALLVMVDTYIVIGDAVLIC
jgi:KUP system potassium uptake protein